MPDFASVFPLQKDVSLKLRPVSRKVVYAELTLTISSVLIREGKATYASSFNWCLKSFVNHDFLF